MDTGYRHNCTVCGGCDFIKENGYFYCVECQTQCEGIREQVFEEPGDNEEDGLLGVSFVAKKLKKKDRIKTKKKGEDFTSWEMLNFVLRGLVEELISYGAPKTIRDTVLQLWAYYLQKLEIAFFSKEENALPKLGLRYYDQDATFVYGQQTLKTRKKTKRTTVSNASVNAEMNTSICTVQDWGSQQIRRKLQKKAKKAFMDSVAEISRAEIAETESTHSSLDHTSVFDISAADDLLSVSSTTLPAEEASISPKLERSQIVKEIISKKGLDETAEIQSDSSPLTLTRLKLVVVLYLAVLYEGTTIQLSDLLRWVREGNLSYHEAAKFLPDACYVEGKYHALFRLEENFPKYATFLEYAKDFISFLDMTDWPVPKASEIAKKYVTELQLPSMFTKLVERFVALVPLAYNKLLAHNLHNYEAAILAIIIIILKLLFGLDGRTEHQISKVGSQLNLLMKRESNEKPPKQLFVWKDWVQQLICRRAVLTQYHFPTKHLLCPEAYGNPFAYINYCKNWNEENAGFEEKYNLADDQFLRVVHPALVNTLTCVLEKLEDPTSSKNDDIKFPPTGTPYSLYIKKIIEKSDEVNPPLLAKPARDILMQDFSQYDVAYLLQPESLVNLASAHGHQLNIKKKSAQKKFKTLAKKNKKKLLILDRLKGTVIVAVTNTNTSKKKTVDEKQEAEEILKKYKRKMKKLQKKEKTNKKRQRTKKNSGKKESGKVEKNSKKKKDGEAIKDSKAKPSAHICGKTRKRRKEGLPLRNSKKIKLSKLWKLYIPSTAHWFHDITDFLINDAKFENKVSSKFPFSFSWLLSECAFVSEMSQLSVYKEVVRIEKHCYNIFK